MITSFTGNYDVLSNFYEDPFRMPRLDHWFKSGEHAFQAAKMTTVFDYQAVLQAPTASAAKKVGRSRPMAEGWDERKRAVMLEIIMAKFDPGSVRAQRLIATGAEVLVEGNTWGDVYWGAVSVVGGGAWPRENGMPLPGWEGLLAGHNWLGRLLMMWREVITP